LMEQRSHLKRPLISTLCGKSRLPRRDIGVKHDSFPDVGVATILLEARTSRVKFEERTHEYEESFSLVYCCCLP